MARARIGLGLMALGGLALLAGLTALAIQVLAWVQGGFWLPLTWLSLSGSGLLGWLGRQPLAMVLAAAGLGLLAMGRVLWAGARRPA